MTDSIQQAPSLAPVHASENERRRPNITLFGLLVFLGTLGLLAALVLPTFWRDQARGRLSACGKSGLHNIGTALEMYATDEGGRYPAQLSQLTPKYLSSIPLCPENNSHYTYQTGPVGLNADARHDNYYRLLCKEGHLTVGVPAGYPRYESGVGLIER